MKRKEPGKEGFNNKLKTLSRRITGLEKERQRLAEIEEIMSDGLADVYSTLDSKQQQEVKEEGEKAANEIESIIEQGVVVAKKILNILRDWLKIIPGVNKYFLEQESKLKTDKIMAITRKR